MFFAPSPEALPQPRRGGDAGCAARGCDIVRIHRAQVCDYVYQGQRGRNLVAKVGPAAGHPASYLLFDGREEGDRTKENGVAGEDATTPYFSSSRGFSWEPEAEPKMLEALRVLSAFLARREQEEQAAAAAVAAAADKAEEEGRGGGAAAAVDGEAPPPLPLLMAAPPFAVRHLGHVLSGEAGSCDLGPVRVEAVEEQERESGATVLWVFDGSDARPLAGGDGGAAATATLSRLSVVLAKSAATASGGGSGRENASSAAAVVDAATAAAINGDEKAAGSDADEVVVPAGPARDAAGLPEALRAAILGGKGAAGRRRAPPASCLPSLPPVGTVLPVVLALARSAPRPPLPAVGEWISLHKLAAASVGGGGGARQQQQQLVGVYLESSHWARTAASSSSGPPPFRADPASREREGETATWAPKDRSLLVAVPRSGEDGAATTKKKKTKKRGREEVEEVELPARATLRALTQRAMAASAEAAVRARVLCRVLRAEPSSNPSSSSSSSASSSFDVDLLIEDATGTAEAALRGREAEAFFFAAAGEGGGGRGGRARGSSLAERCAALVAGGGGGGGSASGRPFFVWAELVIEAKAGGGGGAAAASRNKKRHRGGGGGAREGEAGASAAGVAFAVVDSVSRWPLVPSSSSPSSSPPASPPGATAASPLAATQAVPPRGSGGGEAALAATQPPPPPLQLAPTQAVGGAGDGRNSSSEQQLKLTQTQAVSPLAGLAETYVLSPLRKVTARVRAALPGGGGGATTGQGE